MTWRMRNVQAVCQGRNLNLNLRPQLKPPDASVNCRPGNRSMNQVVPWISWRLHGSTLHLTRVRLAAPEIVLYTIYYEGNIYPSRGGDFHYGAWGGNKSLLHECMVQIRLINGYGWTAGAE